MKDPAVHLSATDSRMSSLEIAELTDKQHFHVIRDIKSLIDEEAITESNFGCSEYKDASGKKNPMYSLDFKATMVLITGYDARRRAAVIDRWIALETGRAQPKAESKSKKLPSSLLPVEKEFRAALRLARGMGLKGAKASIAADRITEELTGFSPMDMMFEATDQEYLPDPDGGPGGVSPPAGMVPTYLNLLENEWRAGRSRIRFLRNERENRLEALVTMKDLFTDFGKIAGRYGMKEMYRSPNQLAAKCLAERKGMERTGWTAEKTTKVNGIQRYLLSLSPDPERGCLQDIAPLSGEPTKEYLPAPAAVPAWN